MDKINTSLLILTVSGIITLAIGCSYIPPTGGTVPQGETPDDFNRRQQEAVFNSSGFKTTMIGTGITIASVITLWIRSCIYDYQQVNFAVKEPRSILKVKRATVLPQDAGRSRASRRAPASAAPAPRRARCCPRASSWARWNAVALAARAQCLSREVRMHTASHVPSATSARATGSHSSRR